MNVIILGTNLAPKSPERAESEEPMENTIPRKCQIFWVFRVAAVGFEASPTTLDLCWGHASTALQFQDL